MDIVERLKQEFSGTALEDVADQVRVYVKERHEAADEIERLRGALQHILTHCKSDSPPNAQALILFVNNALGEKE